MLYLLTPIDEDDKRFTYECLHGIVVRAANETKARQLASAAHLEEGALVWLDKTAVKCERVKTTGDTGVILTSILYG